MKAKNWFGLFGLLLIGIVATVGIASAFGIGGLGFKPGTGNMDDISAAIEDNDFPAWKEAMSAQLTEDNFNQLVERNEAESKMLEQSKAIRQALEDGDYETWKELIQSIESLPSPKNPDNQANETQSNETHHFEVLSEEDFNILVEINQARIKGDFEAAQGLSEQLENTTSISGMFGMSPGFDHGVGKSRNDRMRGPGMDFAERPTQNTAAASS